MHAEIRCGLAVAVLRLFAHKTKADVLIDQPQRVAFRNLVFQAEVVCSSPRMISPLTGIQIGPRQLELPPDRYPPVRVDEPQLAVR